jgi:hypothetical protein
MIFFEECPAVLNHVTPSLARSVHEASAQLRPGAPTVALDKHVTPLRAIKEDVRAVLRIPTRLPIHGAGVIEIDRSTQRRRS